MVTIVFIIIYVSSFNQYQGIIGLNACIHCTTEVYKKLPDTFCLLRSVVWTWKSFGLRILCFHCISFEWWVKKVHGLVHGFLNDSSWWNFLICCLSDSLVVTYAIYGDNALEQMHFQPLNPSKISYWTKTSIWPTLCKRQHFGKCETCFSFFGSRDYCLRSKSMTTHSP